MRRTRPLLAVLVVLLAGCSVTADRPAAPARASSTPAPTAPTAAPTASFAAPSALVWSSCERGFECAVLRVPLTQGGQVTGGGEAGAGTADLAVTRHRATGSRVGSLVINPGGPGASAVDSLQGSSGSLPVALREHFDLVAFDPLGVGRSSAVHCGSTAELDRYYALDPSPDTPAELTAYEKGNAALVAGCEQRAAAVLPYMSTVEVAADMERLRAALGDEPLNYLGYSYGTAIGAAYLDAFPTHVRAMVLDGALDPTLSWEALLAGQSRGFDAALGALLADCERTRCALRQAVQGDLPAAFDALAARVEAAPLPAAGGRTVGPDEFSLGVGAGLYNRQYGWPAVEAALAAAERGDGRGLLTLSDSYLERTDAGYRPILESYLAVTCLDRPWPREPQAYVDLAARLAHDAPRFGPAIALSGLPCATWPVPPASIPHPVRGEGAPPVVVVGTTRDPATPYAWAVALAHQLASGILLTHDGDGHTVYRAGAPGCITEPLNTYLLTGQAPSPARC